MFKSKLRDFKRIGGKFSVIFLTCLYLLFSVGIIKATHFCMGREASVAFFTTETEKCPCSLFAGKSSCCADENDLIRLDNEQKVFSTFNLSGPEWIVLENLYTGKLLAVEDDLPSAYYHTNESRPLKIPRWKFNCSLVL